MRAQAYRGFTSYLIGSHESSLWVAKLVLVHILPPPRNSLASFNIITREVLLPFWSSIVEDSTKYDSQWISRSRREVRGRAKPYCASRARHLAADRQTTKHYWENHEHPPHDRLLLFPLLRYGTWYTLLCICRWRSAREGEDDAADSLFDHGDREVRCPDCSRAQHPELSTAYQGGLGDGDRGWRARPDDGQSYHRQTIVHPVLHVHVLRRDFL